MIATAITYIESVIQGYGAWGVLIATFIEEAVAPIPSALVPTAAGFFLIPPELALVPALLRTVVVIALPVAVGVTLGASAVYGIAYAGGRSVIERFGKWVGLQWEQIETMQRRFTGKRSDELLLFVFRLIPIIPGVGLSGFCGVVRYPFVPFAVITFLGAFLRAVALGLLGWWAGELYQQYFEIIDRIEGRLLIGLVVVVAAAAAYYFWHRKGGKQGKRSDSR